MDRISKCSRFVIGITILYSLSLGQLGEGFRASASLVLLDVLGR